ncbi:MAG: proteasome accessory factor PafA2 [Acidimicrobiia bacterium]|nr:proteasome accessory factor PafA2 [Acidimicrobiia bacterium]
MAIAKIMGIETEYGIMSNGTDSQYQNPMTSSGLLINAYLHGSRTEFDFADETPAQDARIEVNEPPSIFPETHLINAMLTNGARYYVDHAHPEYASPEVSNALEAVLYDRAGEEILRRSMLEAKNIIDGEIIVYKNNTDSKGNSYGTHEGYLVQRNVPFTTLVNSLTSHFVSRQIFCGAGKVGSELHASNNKVDFQISQRADFMEEPVGLETTMKRPIVNTRDEPHSDASKYRRLHIIVGDANMCDVSTFLKLGTTAIILAMIEDDFEDFNNNLCVLVEPVKSIKEISHDTTLKVKVETNKGFMTALDIQKSILDSAKKYISSCTSEQIELIGGNIAHEILKRWEDVLAKLETNPESLSGQVDWITKKKIIDGFKLRDNLEANDPKLCGIDVQYHDIRKGKLFDKMRIRGEIEALVSDKEIVNSVDNPPETTRAYFRGSVLKKFAKNVHSANWDSVTLDIGSSTLKRIPMMEPTRGNKDSVQGLLDSCDTPIELINKLEE